MSKFRLKDHDDEEVEIAKGDIEEIVPDADFRFSLIILKTGAKYFIEGSKAEILQELEIAEMK